MVKVEVPSSEEAKFDLATNTTSPIDETSSLEEVTTDKTSPMDENSSLKEAEQYSLNVESDNNVNVMAMAGELFGNAAFGNEETELLVSMAGEENSDKVLSKKVLSMIDVNDMTITLLPRTLNQLSIGKFPKLKYLPFKDFEDLPSLEYLVIWNCPELTSLPSLPSSLLQLRINDCPLMKEACKRDKGKEWTKIADIPCVMIEHKFIYDPEEAFGN